MQANKRLIGEMIEQVWNERNPGRLAEFWADDTRPEAAACALDDGPARPLLPVRLTMTKRHAGTAAPLVT